MTIFEVLEKFRITKCFQAAKIKPNEDGGRGVSEILLKFSPITHINQEHSWFEEELDQKNVWKNKSP